RGRARSPSTRSAGRSTGGANAPTGHHPMTDTTPSTAVSPLAGLRVLDLSTGIAGAVATMLLRDFGAEVTLAEPRGGHPLAREPGVITWARGKRRLRADPATAPGRERVRRLAAEVDVLVDDLAPGELERLGL